MSDVRLPKLAGPVRWRPFVKGQSGTPAGRRYGSRNRATIAAAAFLAGEAEALTRRAAELALVGDPWTFSSRACPLGAMPPCLERILPPCRDRMVKFVLPPIESAADIAGALKAVTSALAGGAITPGEAATIAAVVDTFVRAIQRLRAPFAAGRGRTLQSFGRRNRDERRRAGPILQPIGEICCRFAADGGVRNNRFNWRLWSAGRPTEARRRCSGSTQCRPSLRFWEPSFACMIETGAATQADQRGRAVGVMFMLNHAAPFSPPIGS
jgi:hypothetical protein